MRYFKRYWDETPGGEHDRRGTSWWLFEVDENGDVQRQIEQYANGLTLKYGPEHREDENGGLAIEFDLSDMAPYAIEQREFEENWRR
jgi:hypothetical protein